MLRKQLLFHRISDSRDEQGKMRGNASIPRMTRSKNFLQDLGMACPTPPLKKSKETRGNTITQP